MADFSFSEDAELQQLNQSVIDDPENFENWDKLVRAAEEQEGGLHRNSSPSAIAATRDVYDRLLARFPLFFGYWKKYADLEFTIAGTEAADMVYERGVASIPISADLWANYCTFKTETCHDPDLIRGLFERGAEAVGIDFLSDRFWDKYVEWEERNESPLAIYNLYERLTQIPLHQYNRYFEMAARYQAKLPLASVLPADQLQALQQAVIAEKGDAISPYEMEQCIRAKLEDARLEQHKRLAADVASRWEFEEKIKRPYYHVTDLDDEQIDNWSRYLDFEEAMGGFERTRFLFERCLVTAANYPQFWFRYARWMSVQQPPREEEVRNIYQRASCTFVPIAEPAIRHQYAVFEEATGRVSVAIDILEAILMNLPHHVHTIQLLAELHHRHYGIQAAANILFGHIKADITPFPVRGALVAHLAHLTYEYYGVDDSAREVFRTSESYCTESKAFWQGWLNFEIGIPGSPDQVAARHEAIAKLHNEIRTKAILIRPDLVDITNMYMHYLKRRGGKDAMKEWLQLDLDNNSGHHKAGKISFLTGGSQSNKAGSQLR